MSIGSKHIFIFLLLLSMIWLVHAAQDTDPKNFTPTTMPINPSPQDTLGLSTSSADELRRIPQDSLSKPTTMSTQKTSDVDTIITYSARTIRNEVEERKSYFIGDAVVNYKHMTLKAGKICIDWDNHLLIAESLPDSVWIKKADGSDSVLTVKFIGEPILIEEDSQMIGEKMIYNYKTEKGRVIKGRTAFEDGFYGGRQIKMVDKKTIYVSHSQFTTCDRDSAPHFHFEARRLKMIINERVIAKPVVMYISQIPVAALPFAFFPTQKGRHSGIIIPHYGESMQEGRYLRDLGYYWAPSDYFDVRSTIDFFEKTGWLLKGGVNYAVRYLLNGRLAGSVTRKNFSSGYQSRRWDLNIYHNQEFDPTAKLSVNGYFVSDNSFYRDLSINLYSRLTRELRSNATFSKFWPEQKLSLSINASQVRDLQENTTQTTLPQLSFRKSQTQLFKSSRERSSEGGSLRKQDKWYHYLYFSYGSNFAHSRREFWQRTPLDTTKKLDRHLQMNHNMSLSLSSPKKYFRVLAVNHYLDFQEDWFDKTYLYYLDPATNQIKSKKQYGFAARHTFSYSASANTKIYGMFAPKIGDIQAIRHVVTPSLSFNYRPDFSDAVWGYFQEIQDTLGRTFKKDRFGGSTYAGGNKMVSLSIRNLFQMKRGTGEKVKKMDLFSMDVSTGYNFDAEKYRLSDLRTSWQANPARIFSLSANTNHSFYAWDPIQRTRVNRYLFEDKGWQRGEFIRLTSFNLNFSLRLESKKVSVTKKKIAEFSETIADTLLQEEGSVLEEAIARKGDRFSDVRAFQGVEIPWRVNFTFNFYLDKSRDPQHPIKRYYLNISGAELSLTPNWRIGYSGHYDLAEGKINYHRFTFYRNLHCWEAQVDWVPSGVGKRVYFRINVKSSMLRDLKLERHAGRSSVLGY